MTDELQATSAERKSLILILVIFGSILWLGTGVVLFLIAAPCSEASTFWESRIACLPPNEMGDSLAGAFAPLAFLWLIAAVFLQRNELTAQRQELRLSRKVAGEQVREAQRSAEFIGQQTDLLRSQMKREEASNADDALEELLDLFIRTIRIAAEEFVAKDVAFETVRDDYGQVVQARTIHFEPSDGTAVVDHCREYLTQIGSMSFEITDIWPSTATIEYDGLDHLIRAFEILSKAIDLYEVVSPAKRGWFDFIGALEGHEQGLVLIGALEERGKRRNSLMMTLDG